MEGFGLIPHQLHNYQNWDTNALFAFRDILGRKLIDQLPLVPEAQKEEFVKTVGLHLSAVNKALKGANHIDEEEEEEINSTQKGFVLTEEEIRATRCAQTSWDEIMKSK